MATHMFLKIDGVEGESRDGAHEKEIDVLSWNWGMTQPASFHLGGGGGAGKVNVQDLSVTKNYDKASAKLMHGCASGQHFGKATLTVRKAGGEHPVEYLVLELSHVMITSISTGGSGGEDRLTENVTLNFATVKTTYTPQNERGEPEGDVEFGWDIETNVPL